MAEFIRAMAGLLALVAMRQSKKNGSRSSGEWVRW